MDMSFLLRGNAYGSMDVNAFSHPEPGYNHAAFRNGSVNGLFQNGSKKSNLLVNCNINSADLYMSGKDRARMLLTNLFGKAPSRSFIGNVVNLEPSFKPIIQYSESPFLHKIATEEVAQNRNGAFTPQVLHPSTPAKNDGTAYPAPTESSPYLARIETSSRKSSDSASSKIEEVPKRLTNRMRITCDRCTRLKTKCIREEGKESCNRCSKGGYCCVYTCQRKRGRVPRKELEMHASSALMDMAKINDVCNDELSSNNDFESDNENDKKRGLESITSASNYESASKKVKSENL